MVETDKTDTDFALRTKTSSHASALVLILDWSLPLNNIPGLFSV